MPASVEVRLFGDSEHKLFQILLVNLTTNPLVRSPGGWGVVRYVTLQKGLMIDVRTDSTVRSVSSLKGVPVSHSTENGVVKLEIPVLELYDSITVECV